MDRLQHWVVFLFVFYLVILAYDWTGSGNRCGSFSLLVAGKQLLTFLKGLRKINTNYVTHQPKHREM